MLELIVSNSRPTAQTETKQFSNCPPKLNSGSYAIVKKTAVLGRKQITKIVAIRMTIFAAFLSLEQASVAVVHAALVCRHFDLELSWTTRIEVHKITTRMEMVEMITL